MKHKRFHLAKWFFGLFTIVLLFAAQSMAQSPTFLEPCAKAKEPPAEFGPQQPTLCQRYTPDPSEPSLGIQIGSPGRQLASQIVALIGSNQLPGNVSVVGNFTVDVDFSFVNAVCTISPNVQIVVAGDILLTLDNAKLFCCSTFWRGILLAEDGDIITQNITEIEDALIAIDVPCPSSTVSIQSTIFNRNLIGINIGHESMLLTPCSFDPNSLQFDLFADNLFQCTSPLNGSQNGVGLCGIRILGNTVLHIGIISSAPSYFRHMRYGIYAPMGSETTLIINKCRFEDLLDSGIYQASGDINIFQSRFTNCYANGIRQDFTRNLTVKTCWFVYDSDLIGTPTDFHNGIYAKQFGLGSQVSITYSHFEISNVPGAGKCRGIYLKPGQNGVSAETQIDIDFNQISVQTGPGFGIVMEDNFLNLKQGMSSIYHNEITLFNAFSTSHVYGIYLTGEFQYFSVSENDFFGLQGPDLGLGNGHTSLYFYGHGNSTHNIIANNTWHLPENQTTEEELTDLDFERAMVINTQEFASICDNRIQNVFNVGTFSHLGLNSVFSNNTFAWMAKGPHIDEGSIGPQDQESNVWTFPAVEANGLFYGLDIIPQFGYHIKCTPNPANSLFLVHTPQATGLFDVNHPFHPFDIEPDLDNEFFDQQMGIPQECQLPGLLGDVPDADKWLADGNIAALQYTSDTELWRHQCRLYRLLKTDTNYYASYPGFPGFVTQHQNGSVGKFYQVNALMSQSSCASEVLSSEVLLQQQLLRSYIAEIISLDSLLQLETSSAVIASLKAAQAASSEEITSTQSELENLQIQYESPRPFYYYQALALNSAINAVAIYEINEKAVNQVILNALLNQSGHLTEEDAQILNGIATQCPKTGGIPVMRARALLEDCYENASDDYTVECFGEYSAQVPVTLMIMTSLRNETNPRTSAVINGDIILEIVFVEGSRYSLYDLNGRELCAGNLDASLRVSTPSSLSNGVYICTVIYPSGQAIAQKVVIFR